MHHPFLRFLLVGVINTIVGMSVIFLLLHLLGLNYWLSTSAGTIIGACVSYILNRSFTFKSQKSIATSLPAFFLVMGICYALSYFISHQASPWILNQFTFISKHFRDDIAVLIGMGLYTIINYFGQKFIVFRAKELQARS